MNENLNESVMEGTKTSETASDQFEVAVAENIKKFLEAQEDGKYKELEVSHSVDEDKKYYSDVKITNPRNSMNVWVEVKLNKYANLGGLSFKYNEGKWSCTTSEEDDPLTKIYLDAITSGAEKFISFCKDYLKKDDIKLPTDLSPELIEAWKKTGSIEDTENDVQFITEKIPLDDFGEKIASFYQTAKNEPVYYIQVDDELYIIDRNYNPLGLRRKDGGELKTLAEAYRKGRIQFRAKGINRTLKDGDKYYYSVYCDVKILSDKENDNGIYECSFKTPEKFPVIEGTENVDERKFDYALKDKEHTYKPEKNRYQFKNRTEGYGGDDYLYSSEILELVDPNMSSRFGLENWFHGPDCLKPENSKVYMVIDDGKDTRFNVSDVVNSKKYRAIIYLTSEGDAMKTEDFARKMFKSSEFLGTLRKKLVVMMNKTDESLYVCNRVSAEGDDIILHMEWGDAIDYSDSLDEADHDIGGDESDQAEEYHGTKIWIDDIREAPEGFKWIKTVRGFIKYVDENGTDDIELIDTDHDAGDYQSKGGDYIRCFDYLDYLGSKNITVHIHSANPVGANNIRRIISKNKENGWKEIRNTQENEN